jgi:biotin-(acetyl-CoA carboxylase) ligase
LAISLVNSEDTETYLNILNLLKTALLIKKNNKIVLMSDKAGGIIAAAKKLDNYYQHEFCIVHWTRNLAHGCKGMNQKLHSQLVRLAKATSVDEYMEISKTPFRYTKVLFLSLNSLLKEFKETMDCIPLSNRINNEINNYSCLYKKNRFGNLTNNVAESVNNWIFKIRNTPEFFDKLKKFIEHFEDIRQKRSEYYENSQALVAKRCLKQYEAFAKNSDQVTITALNGVDFKVTVNLISDFCVLFDTLNNNYNCSCNYYLEMGIPCVHMVKVMEEYNFKSSFHLVCFKARSTDFLKSVYKEKAIIPALSSLQMNQAISPERNAHPLEQTPPRFRVRGEGYENF